MYETNEQMSKRIDKEIWDRVAKMTPAEIKMHGRMALGPQPQSYATIEILLAILVLLLIFH